jgi:hypothetical protein
VSVCIVCMSFVMIIEEKKDELSIRQVLFSMLTDEKEN